MSATAVNRDHTDRFRAVVARRFGLDFDETKAVFLSQVLERRTEIRGLSTAAYLDHLETHARDELRALAGELTVGETYFFRNAQQLHAFAEVALPQRMKARADERRLRILSAACASGEEPYSLAIVCHDGITEDGWDVAIKGVDVNPTALERARRAVYSVWSLRETPVERQRRWFSPEGRDFALVPQAAEGVVFEEKNLIDEDDQLWQRGSYDIVFCRNFLMYLTTEAARSVVARLSRSLAPGGFLFLGHAETLRGLSTDFHLRHTHETFYYQRKDSDESAGVAREYFARPPAPLPVALDTAATWIETIQTAAERIKTLTEDVAAQNAGVAPVTVPAAHSLGVALELLKRERFIEALDLLETLPPLSARDPDILLLRAVLLTHSGAREGAEKACAELLARDEFSAGAHYLLALCSEGAGDRAAAISHDQVAGYLDPAFAMPRLHLGLMARSAGDRGVARRELTQAALLLEREDASRLLLFGGGFSREALMAFCRTETGGVGGRR